MQKLLTFFSKTLSVYVILNDQSFNNMLTNYILILNILSSVDTCCDIHRLSSEEHGAWLDFTDVQTYLIFRCLQNLEDALFA